MQLPAATRSDSGAAVIPKSRGVLSTSVSVVLWVQQSFPTRRSSDLEPATVPAPTVRFSVEDDVAGFGLNDAVTPPGAPLRLNVTLPLNPPEDVVMRQE